jgi:hypothetical protein
MALCGPNRCGCALRSTSLSISGDGSTTNPWNIESLLGAFEGRFYEFASNAERDAQLPPGSVSEGDVAYIRDAPNRLMYYEGTTWLTVSSEPTDWTPSLTGVTTTSGTLLGRYAFVGMRTIRVVMKFTLGASSAVTGTAYSSLPWPAAHSVELEQGNVTFSDATGARSYGRTAANGNASVILLPYQVVGIYIAGTVTTANIPFTWAVNDQIRMDLTYEV